MKITKETVQYAAALAKLHVSEEGTETTAKDLERILDYISTMNELDTDEVEPMYHVLPLNNVFHEDVVVNTDIRDEIIQNAPQEKDGCFVVPKTVE